MSSNRASMRLRKLKLFFACLLMAVLSIGQVWATDATLTITRDDVTTVNNYGTDSEWTVGTISGYCQIYGSTTTSLQFNGGKPNGTEGTASGDVVKSRRLWNTVAVPGRIKSVTITTASGTERAWRVFCSTSAAERTSTTSYGTEFGSSTNATTSGTTWDVPANDNTNYTYFLAYSNSGNASYISSIVVTYEAGGGDQPTVSIDPEELTFTTVGVEDPAPAAQSFTITGSNMTAALSIAALTNFDYSVTSGSLSPSEGSISATVTVTPKSGFTTSAGDKSETLTISGDDLEDVELDLNAEVKAKHNIIFNNGGVKAIGNVAVMEGATYSTLPTIEDALISSCMYKKFEGWTLSSSINASVKPTLVNSVEMEDENVDLYAVYSVTTGGGSGAAVGTTILSEDFEDFGGDDYPTAPGENATTYASGITYTCDPNSSNGTRVMTSGGAGAEANNIIVKSSGSFAIANIPTGGASTLTFSCAVGGSKTLTITSTSDDVTMGSNTGTSGARIYTLTVSNNATSFGLNFAATGGNMRLDDISIVVATTSSGGSTTYSLDAGCAAPGQCVAPTFSPAAGTFDAAQSVELATTTDEADIYYTTNGNDPEPGEEGTSKYTSAISVTQNTTIKAIAIKDGMTDSEVATGEFKIRFATAPTFGPTEGDYTSAQSVTMAATGAEHIYYTMTSDGSTPADPTIESPEYTTAIPLNANGTYKFKAIAVKAGFAPSNVTSATYTLDLPYANIAAFIAGAPTTAKSLTLNNAVITGVDGTTLYVQDETAGIMIYGLASLPDNGAPNHSISGTIVGKYSSYKNQHELVKPNNTTPIDISGVTISADEVARPAISEYTSLSDAYAAKPMMLVTLKGVNYDGTQYNFDGNKIYNTFGALTDKTMPETTVDCDITGIVIDFNGTLELLPVFASDIVADADAAAPVFTPEGGATEGAAVQVDLNSYITIAAADANHSVDITSAQITTTSPMSVTAVSSRNFYRSTSVTKWYYGNSASASYDITIEGVTTQGTVVAQVNSVDAASAAEGDEVHILIAPNTHFELATITVNGNDPDVVSAGTEYSFEMPAAAVTIAVTWNEDAKYAVTFEAGTGASGDAPAMSGDEYYAGVHITLPANTFTYDASHVFDGWLCSVNSTKYAASADYTMTAVATTFTAQWKEIPNFANGDWILVDDVDELTEGSYVIIASADVDEAMKPYAGGSDKNCKTAEATIDDGILTYNSVFAVYEIREGNKENTFALQDISSDYYLYAASSSSNDMKTEETLTDNSSWTASITSTGDATLVAQGSNTRNVMHYNPNGTNPSVFSCYASTSSVTGLVTLYKYHTPSLKLTYDKNAGDDVVTGMPSMGIADGDNKVTISDATPLRDGYLFDGWNSNPLGGGTVYEANHEYTLTANLTIYAQWQTATAHSLSYDKDGGEGDVPAATDYYPNVNVTLANAVTKTGYIFAGWEYDGNIYAAGTSFTMPNEEVVMKAKYATGAVYTITAVDAVEAQGAPESSNATFANTYTNNKNQMTGSNSMTLTLGGYDLYTVKAITLRMKSNGSSGNGTLSVTIGGNAVSFTTNKWYDGEHYSSSYEDIKVTLTPQIRVQTGENIVIVIAASQNSLYCQSFAIEYERVLDDIRTGLSDGKWGTICPKQEVKYPSGAVFYQLTYMEQNPDNSPYKFFFDEIAEGASLEAGKPYLFIAEGEVIKGIKVGLEAADGDHAYNGFVGYLGTSNKPLTSDAYTFTNNGYNYYGLQNNIFKLIGSGQIVNERAYVEVSPDRAPSTTPVPMPAYGRRRLVVGAGAPQVTTGTENIEASETPVKVMIDGQLFILRGEKMYDATGRLVK